MKSVRSFAFALLALGLAACDQEPLKSKSPGEPAPLTQGVQAFVQVDNVQASPGEQVKVYVRVQMGTENAAKLGSYTGRLRFNPEALKWVADVQINDGLRVTNPNGAEQGELRFAGAAAGGFSTLALYQGTFEVKKPGYMDGLELQMEEISAAGSLSSLQPQLQVAPQIFRRVEGR